MGRDTAVDWRACERLADWQANARGARFRCIGPGDGARDASALSLLRSGGMVLKGEFEPPRVAPVAPKAKIHDTSEA